MTWEPDRTEWIEEGPEVDPAERRAHQVARGLVAALATVALLLLLLVTAPPASAGALPPGRVIPPTRWYCGHLAKVPHTDTYRCTFRAAVHSHHRGR